MGQEDKTARLRAENYKKKSDISLSDKRSLRAHRRSTEWKQMRNDTVSQKRRLESVELSPVKETHPVKEVPDKSNAVSRREMLKKWREEKELKKKLESKKTHQTFKVAHFNSDLVAFSKPLKQLPKVLNKAVPVKSVVKKATTVPKTPEVARKITVSAAGKRAVSTIPASKRISKATTSITKPTASKTVVSAAPKRVTRSQTAAAHHTSKPASSQSTQGAAGKPNKSQPTAAAGKEKKYGKKASVASSDKHVTSTRGGGDVAATSFAPSTYRFKAPDNVETYRFKPLSPASADMFLSLPINTFSPAPRRSCSTPFIARPSTGPKVIHSPPPAAPSSTAAAPASLASEKDADICELAVVKTSLMDTDASESPVAPVSSKKTKACKSTAKKSLAEETAQDKLDGGANSKRKSSALSKRKSSPSGIQINIEMEEQASMNIMQEADTKIEETSSKKSAQSLRRSAASKADIQQEQKSIPNRRSTRKSTTVSSLNSDVDKSDKPASKTSCLSADMETDEPVRQTPRTQAMNNAFENMTFASPSTSTKLFGKDYSSRKSSSSPMLLSQGSSSSSSSSSKRMVSTPGSILRAGSKHSRTKSVSFNANTPHNNRSSLALRKMSPEEGVEILKNSPMVVMDRKQNKTPSSQSRKSIGGSISMPSFDDLDMLSAPLPACDLTEEEATSASIKPVPSFHVEEVADMSPGDKSQASSTAAATQQEEEEQRDVPYFRARVAEELKLLADLCEKWTAIEEGLTDVSERVHGEISTVVGKARLLVSKKGRFTQFTTLLDACEFQTGEKKTTVEDLQGFWDMVYVQVENIYKEFGDLDKLQDCGWHLDIAHFENEQPVKKVIKKVIKKKATASKAPSNKGPSKFAAFRAQMKQQQEQMKDDSEPVDKNILQVPQDKTFDAGFFKVKSPVKTPEYHCEAGTPLQKQSKEAAGAVEEVTTPQRRRGSRSLVRSVLERSARKHTPAAAAVTRPAEEESTAQSPSKKRCITPVSSARKSAARRSSRISMHADSSFLQFLQPTTGLEEEDEEGAMMELSLNTSPAAAPFNGSSVPPIKEFSTPQPSKRKSTISHQRLLAPDRRRRSAAVSKENQLTPSNINTTAKHRVSSFTPPIHLTPVEHDDTEEQTVNLMCFSPQ